MTNKRESYLHFARKCFFTISIKAVTDKINNTSLCDLYCISLQTNNCIMERSTDLRITMCNFYAISNSTNITDKKSTTLCSSPILIKLDHCVHLVGSSNIAAILIKINEEQSVAFPCETFFSSLLQMIN